MRRVVEISIFLFAAFAIWALGAFFDVGGQRQLFYDEGRSLLSDFTMPRICADEGYREDTVNLRSFDRCYPALAVAPLRIFPNKAGGAWGWTILVTLVYLLTLCLISGAWWPTVFAMSMPVLYNLERGNSIALAAAAVGVFLAWYRSELRWRRGVAMTALGIAACLKLSPAMLGVLYLRERDWKSVSIVVALSVLLFGLPWIFIPNGFANLPAMLENAVANFHEYCRASEFGIIPIWRMFRVVMHQDCQMTWTGCLEVVRFTQLVGLLLVGWGAWKCELLVVVGGMLLAAGNMHYYGMLYLLPVFVIEISKINNLRLVLWLVMMCPLQLVVFGHSGNALLGNLALIGLLITRILNGGNECSSTRL